MGILGEILKFVTTNWRIIVDCFLAILFYLIFYTYFNKFKLNVRQYLVGVFFYLLLFVGMILNLKSVMIISFLILNLFIVAFVNNFRADIKKTLLQRIFKRTYQRIVVLK